MTLVGQQDERKINPKLKSNPDVCNELILDRKVKINIDRFDEDRKDISQSQFTIYTNGSKIKEDTGPGFIIYYNKQSIYVESITLQIHTTVFQAEIIAINHAC